MQCKFMPGDRVVCVDAAAPAWAKPNECALREGAVYTVTHVYVDCVGDPGVMLREVSRPAEALEVNGGIAGYYAHRFRRAEDIEQFRRIVAKAPRALVDAGGGRTT